MEQLTEKDSVQLSNTNEQLLSLRREIDKAGGELEAILEKRRLESDAFSINVAEHEQIIDGLNKKEAELRAGVHSLLEISDVIDERAQDLIDKKTEIDSRIQQIITNLDKLIANKETHIIVLDTTIDYKKQELNEVEFSIKQKTDVFEIERKSLQSHLDAIRDDIALQSKILHDTKKSVSKYESDITYLEEQYVTSQKKASDEYNKVEHIHNALSVREAEIEQKRQVVSSLIKRATRVWSKMYPGQDFTNLMGFKDV